MYVCMYICHTLIAWVWFLWSHPQTPSHVVLVRPGGDWKDCVCARAKIEQRPHGIGPARRRSMCENIVQRAEMEQEQSKHDRARERRRKQRDTASEESIKGKGKRV